jgi:hypothetical protein
MPSAVTANATESVGLIGLNNTATKNKLTDTIVPIWDLATVSSGIPDTESFYYTNTDSESVVGDDGRVLVSKEHFAPGGKYRCTWNKQY